MHDMFAAIYEANATHRSIMTTSNIRDIFMSETSGKYL